MLDLAKEFSLMGFLEEAGEDGTLNIGYDFVEFLQAALERFGKALFFFAELFVYLRRVDGEFFVSLFIFFDVAFRDLCQRAFG